MFSRVSDGGCAACSLVIRPGELPVVGSQLFEPAATSGLATSGSTVADRKCVFAASGHCAVTSDATTALLRDGDALQSRDLSASGVARSLPVTDKMATVDGHDDRASEGSLLLFGVSPKDPLIGVVLRQSVDSIELWDAKSTAGVGAVAVLRDDGQSGSAAVSDFSFMPATGQVSITSSPSSSSSSSFTCFDVLRICCTTSCTTNHPDMSRCSTVCCTTCCLINPQQRQLKAMTHWPETGATTNRSSRVRARGNLDHQSSVKLETKSK